MTSGATTGVSDRIEVDWPRVTLGVLAGLAGTLLAVAFKVRCGLSPDVDQAFRQLCYSDVPAMWTYARLDTGAVPYIDHLLEYPPLTGLWMWLAAAGAQTGQEFVLRTYGLLLVSGGAVGGLLTHVAGLRRLLVFAAAPTLVVAGAINWDLPSIALALAGVAAHRQGRDGWAGAWLGLGTAAKLWPALLVLPVVAAAWALRGRPAAVRAVVGAAVAWLLTNVPVMVLAPRGWLHFLEFSSERGPTYESLWRLVPDLFGVELSVTTMNVGSAVLTLTGVAAVLWVTVRRDHPRDWHLASLPLITVFVLASKVYSPQFSLWLLPFLALAMPPVWALVLFAITDVAVHATVFPYVGGVLGLTAPVAVWPLDVAVVARAAVLVVAAVVGWRRAAGGVTTADLRGAT